MERSARHNGDIIMCIFDTPDSQQEPERRRRKKKKKEEKERRRRKKKKTQERRKKEDSQHEPGVSRRCGKVSNRKTLYLRTYRFIVLGKLYILSSCFLKESLISWERGKGFQYRKERKKERNKERKKERNKETKKERKKETKKERKKERKKCPGHIAPIGPVMLF